MIELIKKIAASKEDVVFVGSLCLWHLGLIIDPKDIDIVVNSLDGLEEFGEIKIWNTKSPMSVSKKRAHIKREDYDIDIFIEETLPEHTMISGIKFQTLKDLNNHINLVINTSEGQLKNIMIEKKIKYFKPRI